MAPLPVSIRFADPADSAALAALRFRDAGREVERADPQLLEFAEAMGSWMRDHRELAYCAVADAEGELVGMAWLVVVDRVPVIENHARRSGDIQSVFVLPEHRRHDIGRHLIELLTTRAEALGLSRVSLHSSTSAIGFYSTIGFGPSPNLLQRIADG